MTAPRAQFIRARRDGEKATRREAILAAAATLVERLALHEVSLNGIAEVAGISKPNVYRYFESREEILLRLFVADLESFAEQVERDLSGLRAGSKVTGVLVAAYETRPRLCRFLGVVSSVLEQNVRAAVIVDVKRASLAAAERVADALHRVMPNVSRARCLWFNNVLALLVGGLWPPSHPAPAVHAVIGRPEFAGLKPDFRRDLNTAVRVMLAGLEHG